MARLPRIVESPSPTDGQVLAYDSTAKKWKPATPSGGGGVSIMDNGDGTVTILAGNTRAIVTGSIEDRTLISGNFQSYEKEPYFAWTGMWGVYRAPDLEATSSMLVDPDTFPADTTFRWDVTPSPSWGGVNGYLHLDYGNYQESPVTIVSRQVKNIANLTLDVEWEWSGGDGSGLLCECWLASQAGQNGAVVDHVAEVSFHPRLSPSGKAWINTLPLVGSGSFTSGGVKWNVRQGVSGDGVLPYYIAYRDNFADHQGQMPYHDYFAFLKTAGKITGEEWFNGVAFGVEPHSGAGAVTISKYVPTYAAGTPAYGPVERVTNGDFSAGETGWSGVGWGGKSVSGGVLSFSATPAYDGVTQAGLTLVGGKYYELRYTISGITTGSMMRPMFQKAGGGVAEVTATPRSTNGTFTQRLLATAGHDVLQLQPIGDPGPNTMTIDNVSLVGPYDTATVGGA